MRPEDQLWGADFTKMPRGLPWEATRMASGDTVAECHHPSQQGLGRSITGLWVGKATPKIAMGARSSSRGGVTAWWEVCGAALSHSPCPRWTEKGNRGIWG